MPDVVGGSVVWNLDVDKKQLSLGLASAREEVDKTAHSVEKRFSGLGKTISDSFKSAEVGSQMFAKSLLAIGTAATVGLGFGVKMAADTETARQGFVTLLGSAEKADEAIRMIKKDAAATPFELPGLIRANQLLSSVTKDAGRSEGILLNVGKALAAAGKGGAELDNVIVNLQQIANTGRITEMDIRQFGFAGINILELLADQYGVTKEQAGEMIKDSKDAFTDLEKAFQKAGGEGGKFSRAFIDQAGTWNQLVSNFKDVFGQAAGEIVTSTGAFDAVKNALGGLIDAMVKFQPQIVDGIKDFMSFVVKNGPVIAGVIIGGLIPAFGGLAGAIALAMLPLLPWIAAGAAVGFAIKKLLDVFGSWEGVKNAFINTVTTIKNFFMSIPPFFQAVWENIKTGFNEFVTFVSAIPGRILTFFLDLPFNIALALAYALGVIVGWGVNVAEYLFTNVPIWVNNTVKFISELPGRIGAFLVETYNKFVSWGASVLTFIGSIPSRIGSALTTLGPVLKTSFTGAWDSMLEEIKSWPGRLMDWGKNIGQAFVDGIKNGLKSLRDAFVAGFNNARGAVEGQSPPKEGPFKDIDKWGFNVGSAWIDGMVKAMDRFALPSLNNDQPALSTFGANQRDFIGGTSNQTEQNIKVEIGTVDDSQDVKKIARDIGYQVSLLPR